METWQELARECRKSANLLVTERNHRSAVSRAYYAVYSRVTMDLCRAGVAMPAHREGPSHTRIRALIEHRMTHLTIERRLALSRIVGRLYTMRIAADYLPSSHIGDDESREAATLVRKVFENF